MDIQEIEKILKQGGVGVLPTDTLYGLVGSALLPEAVEKIYKLRRRRAKKPMIILIGSLEDLSRFGIKLNSELLSVLRFFWPGKISLILPCPVKKFSYLHRGTKTLAFRLPKKQGLIKLLKKTGPLVAPSANFEGFPPAKTIKEAKNYFGDKIDFYLNGGKLDSLPSTLIEMKNKKLLIRRFGAI